METTLRAELDTCSSGTPSNDVISTIREVKRVMHLSKHALYRGQIYARSNTAQFTYIRLMDVSSYLNKLLEQAACQQCHQQTPGETIENCGNHTFPSSVRDNPTDPFRFSIRRFLFCHFQSSLPTSLLLRKRIQLVSSRRSLFEFPK